MEHLLSRRTTFNPRWRIQTDSSPSSRLPFLPSLLLFRARDIVRTHRENAGDTRAPFLPRDKVFSLSFARAGGEEEEGGRRIPRGPPPPIREDGEFGVGRGRR